jgi:ornithine carbamoyltransferase
MKRDLLTLLDLNRSEFYQIIQEAARLKKLQKKA